MNLDRELKNLEFVSPGGSLALPSDSALSICEGKRRSVRNRKTIIPSAEINLLYHDEDGNLVLQDGTLIKLCDCLQKECSGCHFPCRNCGSQMCGPECQKGRHFVIESIELHQSPLQIRKHPYGETAKRNI
ncbi:unnamed protein product [Dracunculus medinensis]|uniref:ARF7 effector protein C-terminal domain-containing protein n=1 Tax=Dracunculus medinensis TaxID=318479 RepID=A0A3P7T132_DRAME|nr:unnamed protein product [Dracunculus medinensis]